MNDFSAIVAVIINFMLRTVIFNPLPGKNVCNFFLAMGVWYIPRAIFFLPS